MYFVLFFVLMFSSTALYVVQNLVGVQNLVVQKLVSGGAVLCTQWCKIWYQVVQRTAPIDVL
jgi:hypothetical protein